MNKGKSKYSSPGLNPTNITTWNLCLGLQHKKTMLKRFLNETGISVLNLQETKIPHGLDCKILEIPNFSLEVLNGKSK